ncbi:TetR/AcrR family transcriptional regulator [Pseudooceanicola sp. C21-150M6]|uniref:TetR/AcrR family transcriptional regulator n=1 Tax=Pseudooceanicola sp. C21-150M6 TaxID=3434355 RepID=UPI003D7F64CD
MPKQQLSPRKRPLQSRALVTCEAILEAAAQLLLSEGARATTNRIADRAGVSIGSLYQYFPSKEAIWLELIRRMRHDMLQDLEEAAALNRHATLPDITRALLEASVRHHLAAPDRARMLELIEESLPQTEEIAAIKGAVEPLVAGVLTRHNVPRPDIAARDLCAVTAALVDSAVMAGETDMEDVLGRLDRIVAGYLETA